MVVMARLGITMVVITRLVITLITWHLLGHQVGGILSYKSVPIR